MTLLKVYPLHVGTMTRQITNFCQGLKPEIVDLPLICWYIEGSDKRILVDTGGGEPSAADPKRRPYRRDKDQAPENALKKIGINFKDIDLVVITHFHWDHSAGCGLFPKAKIIVQSEELRSANSLPVATPGYTRDVPENVNYTVISGDKEIAKGVRVILTPGHTYGLQGVLVEGETRPIFIASDTYPLFKNLESDPPTISNIYVDKEKYYDSINKIIQLSAFVLPGHDFRVFEREVYY
jgi:glyoxylase-like metal-dependent hydrolase (beta-lactamase superfamily II)